MNLQPSQRRQDSPVRLGNHGYRLDGDFAFLEAELHIPPHCSGTDFALELWACATPHAGGHLQGTQVATIALELPTPIAPHLHRVEARAASNPPSGNTDHAMVLMLVSGGEARRVHDYANYGRLQQFANPALEGAVGYSVEGEHVVLRAEGVANPRARGNSSGTLCLELWAFGEPYAGGEPRGRRLAGAELGSVWGDYRLSELERRAPFTAPPSGRWHLSLLLREWTLSHGYATRDYRNFDVVYEQAAPAAADPAPPPASPPAPKNLRLLEPSDAPAVEAPAAAIAATPAAPSAAVAPAAATTAGPAAPAAAVARAVATPAVPATPAAPVAAAAPVAPAAAVTAAAPRTDPAAPAAVKKASLVSVNAASVDDLAKLPGMNLKVAKEIVKGRPYTSLDALIQVRGVGETTLRRIRSLLSL